MSLSINLTSSNQFNSLRYHQGFLGSMSKAPLSPSTTAGLNSKYLMLQGKLNNLQFELSREQTKLSLLQNSNFPAPDITSLEYAGEPLFLESTEELIEYKTDIIDEILQKKIELIQEIKKLETESIELETLGIIPPVFSESMIQEFKSEKLPETFVDSKKAEKLLKGSSF